MNDRENKKEVISYNNFRRHVNRTFKDVMGFSKYTSTQVIEAMLNTWTTEGMVKGNFISNANTWIDKYGDEYLK